VRGDPVTRLLESDEKQSPSFTLPKFAQQKLKTYLRMKSEMQSIIKEYYHVIGLTPNKSRHQEQVKARAAMMCAMREFKLSTKDIGSVFDTDHSTVCHHAKKHDANLEHWPGYRNNFIAAARLCNETMKYKAMQSKLKYVNAQLNRLNKMKNLLQETIQSKQYG
tara:strand:- start:1518 stop:2009 length:492 start_codon:yes stop_codon:yes gene_type:complete